MNDLDEFKKSAYDFIDWIVEYYKNIESYPVKSQVKPKEIFNKLPDLPPKSKESINQIFSDFQDIILWKKVVVMIASEIKKQYDKHLVIPMTISEIEYFKYIFNARSLS